MFKHLTLLLILLCATTIGLVAQNTFSGTVRDAQTQDVLPGATISFTDATAASGTVTDANGNFQFTYRSAVAKVQVDYIGYFSSVIELSADRENTIYLTADAQQLDEVVVTALGIERDKKALGYAVQEVEGKTISEVRPNNLVNSLSGRLAGVQINNGASGVGSSSRIIIRGESSLSGNNEALFVVDGVPISNSLFANATQNDATGFQEVDYGNGAAEINPDDVESVTILRGAGATALYGARGANGVVVIRTKSGRGTKGIGVSVNSSLTFESALTMPQFQNEYGQGSGGQFAYENGNGAGTFDDGIRSYGPKLDGQLIPQFNSPSTDVNGNIVRAGDVIARNGAAITATPWVANPNNVEDFFQTGRTYINNIALSGANDFGHFRFSYTNLDNEGIIPGTDLQRNSIALSGGYELSKKLHARAFINYINSSSDNRPATGYGSENPLYLFTWMGRQADVNALKNYWQAGQEGLQQFNYNYTWMDNPYFAMFENRNGFDKDRLLGNVAVTYDILDNLSLTLRSGIDTYDDTRQSRRAFSSQRFRNGAYREDLVDFREINTDFLLRYDKPINEDWAFNVSVGGNRMDQRLNYKMIMATELSVPGIYNFDNSRVPLEVDQYNERKRVNSLYTLGQLSYKSGLFLDLSYRNDWSSTLPPNDNSFGYYAVSLSGVLTEFVDLGSTIDFAKVRLSYAGVGNDTDPFNYTNSFVFGQPYGSNPTVSGSSTLRSSEFLPEFTRSFEVGTDIRLWRNRLRFDITYYNNNSVDQIVSLPVPSPSGFTSRVVNGGSIRNQGIEIMVGATPWRKNDFEWNIFANFSKNESRVGKLPEGINQYVTGFARVYGRSDRSVFYIAEEGGRIGDMYGTGLLTVNGRHVYDQAGNPVKDPNLRLLGNYNPDFILGVGNEFRWRNLSFGFLFDFRYGGTIVSRTYAIASTSGVLENTLVGREEGVVGDGIVNMGTADEPRWVENTTAISAESFYNQFFDRDNEANSLYDATYLKLREVRIGYSLPQSLLKRTGLGEVRVSLIGRNLALWTENPHFDPELNAMQGQNLVQGVDDMSYPSSRSYGLSIQLKL